jgi:glycosyltransferase involved in cell wall biosynthesis
MNVLVLHSRYSTGPSSGENRVVDDEVALLRAHGHDVRVWTPDPPANYAFERAALGARAVWSRASVAHVRTLTAELRPDVIHVHNLYPMLSPAVLRTTAAPVVMTLHNYRLMCLPATFLRDGRTCEDCLGRGPWQGVVHRCYRGSAAGSASLATALALHRRAGTFRRVTRFLAVSEFVRTKHIEAGIEPDRIAVKPNFVDPLPRRQGPGEYFLFLGRLAPEKGIGPLVEAWREIPARLVVVGDGEERARLAASAPETVEFHDSVAGDRVGEYLARARALVVPSIWYEGAPRTITEAYAAGVPVIASRCGALPGVVPDGVTGVLAEPGDVTSWRAAVGRLLDDATAVALGDRAFAEWRTSYSPERGIVDLEDAYRAAMDRVSAASTSTGRGQLEGTGGRRA